jgi:mRNA-degrading endonuclease toxin of MazEF toxin-antitoxin module
MNRTDVVLVDWPFTDRAGSKLRPAVVVQADFLNGLIDDTILVQITASHMESRERKSCSTLKRSLAQAC